MKKSFYRITAAALMTTMLAASVVGCSKSSSGGSAATAGTETADPGKQTTGTADASGDLNPLTPPEGVQLKEDLAMGLKTKHTTIDTMEVSNTQHNYMFRMVHDTLVHFNNTTSEL